MRSGEKDHQTSKWYVFCFCLETRESTSHGTRHQRTSARSAADSALKLKAEGHQHKARPSSHSFALLSRSAFAARGCFLVSRFSFLSLWISLYVLESRGVCLATAVDMLVLLGMISNFIAHASCVNHHMCTGLAPLVKLLSFRRHLLFLFGSSSADSACCALAPLLSLLHALSFFVLSLFSQRLLFQSCCSLLLLLL